MSSILPLSSVPSKRGLEFRVQVYTITGAGAEYDAQNEQRAELGRLLKKYGDVWGPWRRDRRIYTEEGEDVMDADGWGA